MTDTIDETKTKLLGFINVRYVNSFIGLIHLLASTSALLLGNYAYLQSIILNNKDNISKQTKITFYICTSVSGLAIYFAFYNKVQSWQLSTTTMEEKGLSATQMQNFNKGRGVIAMIMIPVIPLLYLCCPKTVLNDAMISKTISLIIFLITFHQYQIMKDYGRIIFTCYGLSRILFSLQVLLLSTFDDVRSHYPFMVTFMELESYMVVSCTQFGFLWYYLHSRRLVSKEFIQNCCKTYHPIILLLWTIRLTSEEWWNKLPWLSLSWVMALYTCYTLVFVIKVMRFVVVPKFLAGDDGDGNDDNKEKEVKRSSGRTSLRRRSISCLDPDYNALRSSITNKKHQE